MKPLIVGEAPARGSSRPFQGMSGDRLRRLAEVESLEDYFTLVNLRSDQMPQLEKFDWRAYAEAARKIKHWIFTGQPPIVLLMGRNVERAFFGGRSDREYLRVWEGQRATWVVFPHPSGLNHWWNDPAHVEKAGGFLRTLVRDYGPTD